MAALLDREAGGFGDHWKRILLLLADRGFL
jgi:hypothetical protein